MTGLQISANTCNVVHSSSLYLKYCMALSHGYAFDLCMAMVAHMTCDMHFLKGICSEKPQ